VSTSRSLYLARALTPVLVAAGSAAGHAQDALQGSGNIETVTITGSRIAREGFDMPTPVTMIDQATLEAAAPANLADFVNELPSVVGSSTPATTNRAQSNGGAGINSVNLRSLGSNRTLVLLDGRRSVGSMANGTVDVNTFPQALIKSVEIVTGGASSAYGSDAVSGVVNFILDKQYTGFKTTLEGGETTYGDDRNWTATLTAGIPFADGRGHLLLNGERTRRDGVYGVPRDWNKSGWYMVNNPAYQPGNGEPELLPTSNAGLTVMMPGGIITNTALRGTYFGRGGTVNQFNYGATRDPWTIGGDWRLSQNNDTVSLIPTDERDGLFSYVSFDVTDRVEVFAQASWNEHYTNGWGGSAYNKGNVVIRSDNAFIPEQVRQQLVEHGISQFNLGTWNADIPIRENDMQRAVTRYVAGLKGEFAAWGREWTWDAYYQVGITHTRETLRNIIYSPHMALAQDAVFHPDTGEIVCRSSIADPDNGCVPFNRMGIGVNSQEAIDYVIGDPTRHQRFEQRVAAVNFSTNLDNPWTRPIGLAIGAEHRREEISGTVQEIYRNDWQFGNFLPTFGDYNVTEAYVETLVPLPKGVELNGAVRGTEYSTSGFVTTWKAGLTWQATDDLRFRLTRSRDIRAPGLSELYETGRRRTNTLQDLANGGALVQFLENTTGNPDLKPEEADTLGIGVIFQPSFIAGLSISVDYYDIEVNDAIGQISAQKIADRCYYGNQVFCAAITRGQSPFGVEAITELRNSPFNFVTETARGLDLEMTYRFSLGDLFEGAPGDVTLRALGTHYIKYMVDNGIDPPVDSAGENFGSGPPDWRYRLMATYDLDRTSISLIGRGVSSGVYDNSYIECTSGCPESTPLHRTIANNHIDGAFYLDASLTYRFGAEGRHQVFAKIGNLTNADPKIVANGPSDASHVEPYTNEGLYDTLGRTFRLGVRLDFQ